MNKYFKSLNDSFDIDGDIEEVEIKKENRNIMKSTSKQKYTLEDLQYLKTELQDRIESNREVADELKQSCKIGAPPRLFETYTKLSSTISDDIMHLAELEKTIADYQVIETKEEMIKEQNEKKHEIALKKLENKVASKQNSGQTLVQNNVQNTYNFTSKSLLEQIEQMETTVDANIITNEKDLPEFNLN